MKIIVDDVVVDLKVGADPELFLTVYDKLTSAHGVIPGNKEQPHPVSKGAIQVDGMALEFNINPSESREEFIGNIISTMNELRNHLPVGSNILIESTAEFGSEYINSQPLEARELGCSADFNAYEGGAKNPRPNGALPFRTAAGHIHLGWTENQGTNNPEHLQLCCDVIKLMDLLIGVPSILIDPDVKRRTMYGQAGAFRPKGYGAEYRVLSNFWLKSAETMGWVYNQSAECIKRYLQGMRLTDSELLKVRKVINSSDKQGAIELINKYKVELPANAI